MAFEGYTLIFMNVYFDPLNVACKNVTGGALQGEQIQLNIFLLKEGATFAQPSKEDYLAPDLDAFLLFAKDGEGEEGFPMQKTPFGWSISFSVGETGLYYYAFSFDRGGFVCQTEDLYGYFSYEKGNSFQLTVSSRDYRAPDWFKGGVMYQIFPDRFNRTSSMPDIIGRVRRADWGGTPNFRPNEKGKVLNNDFFGGNLQGVIEKLDYIKSLGVTTIYFNPIFQAASNHRYDTADYMKIDPYLGAEDDFEELVRKADESGIKIILDGVFNHTGDDSVYFNKYGSFPSVGAYQSKDSPYYSWYNFTSFPDEYESWWGIDILPQVNEKSEDYQNFLFAEGGVLKKWLDLGIGGYRLDVADELPDFFLKNLRKSIKESNPNAIIIGEVWEDASNKIAYSERREYLQGYELDSVMNYPLKDAIIRFVLTGDVSILQKTIRTLVDHYPKCTLDSLMNVLGTHDTARILTVFGGKICHTKEEMAKPENRLNEQEKGRAIEKLKLASVLQFTLPGVPCVYYGDENAQEGYSDPFCRGCFDWTNLNEALIEHYRKLGKIREQYREIFKDGTYRQIFAKNGCFAFCREKDGKEIYVFVNNSENRYIAEVIGSYRNLTTNELVCNRFEISERAFGIFVKEE